MNCSSCQTPLSAVMTACVSCGTPVAVAEPEVETAVAEPGSEPSYLVGFGADDYSTSDLGRFWLWAALALVSFPPLGLLALSSARKVSGRLRGGDPVGALTSAARCRKLAVVSVVLSVVVCGLLLISQGGQIDGTFDAPAGTEEFVPSPAPIGPVEKAPAS